MRTYNYLLSSYVCNSINHSSKKEITVYNFKRCFSKIYFKTKNIYSNALRIPGNISHMLYKLIYVLIKKLEQGGLRIMQKSNSTDSYEISSYESQKMLLVNPAQKLVNPAHLVTVNAEPFGFVAICNSLTSLLYDAFNATYTVKLITVDLVTINFVATKLYDFYLTNIYLLNKNFLYFIFIVINLLLVTFVFNNFINNKLNIKNFINDKLNNFILILSYIINDIFSNCKIIAEATCNQLLNNIYNCKQSTKKLNYLV
jgi:hypothetical protein